MSPTNLTTVEAMFARLLGASDRVTTIEEGALNTVYRDSRSAPVLQPWLVAGTVHAWSGGDARSTHASSARPSATERMLDFLLAAR